MRDKNSDKNLSIYILSKFVAEVDIQEDDEYKSDDDDNDDVEMEDEELDEDVYEFSDPCISLKKRKGTQKKGKF